MSSRAGQAANIETVRYYERIGLLPTPGRRGRYRRYGVDDVGRLAFVRRARELGFTLDEIRALLELGTGDCAEARSLSLAVAGGRTYAGHGPRQLDWVGLLVSTFDRQAWELFADIRLLERCALD